jgi:hypothetical protein
MKARMKLFIVAMLWLSALSPVVLADWTEPVPVTEVNTQYQEWAPFLSFDGLSLYFSRVQTNISYYGRIYQATREQPFGSFTSVREISELNQSKAHVFCPWVSPDNLRMYYFFDDGVDWKLMFSERSSVSNPWPQGTSISELNQLGNLVAPKLTADELIIFFSAYELSGGQGGYDIWMATRPDRNSPFGQVRNLDEINTTSHETHPSPSADGLQLHFVSDRNGNFQLFKATRESLDAPFGNVEHLSFFDLLGSNNQFPCLSYDGSALYFMRQVGENWSTRDIWVSYIAITYYVDAVGGNDNNNGLTPQTAFATIQKGINTAKDGDMVLVYPGLYHEGIDFLGKAIMVQGVATPAGIPILENPGDFAASFYNGEKTNSIMKNFVIRNSFMAIFIAGSSPTISNVTVVDNRYGIAVYVGAQPDISNCILWNNTDLDLFGCQARYSWVQDDIKSKLFEGLISHWNFDEGSGTIAHDSAGSNHGTIYGAQWTGGIIGGALNFDGVNDYIDVPDSESLRFSQNDAFSISCWAMPAVGGGHIVCKMRESGAKRVFGYEALWQPSMSAFEFTVESSLTGYTPVRTGNGSAPAGKWYLFTAVYNNKNITVYLDGEQAGTGVFAYNTGSTTPDKNLSIGVRSYDLKMENYFEGLIDDVRIYNRALSAEEIQQLYQSRLILDPLFADPGHGDYHLRSKRGRYWPQHDVWVLDKVTSPCVDGGDPSDNPSGEPMPNGGRIDMGAFGGTPFASMSEWPIAGDTNRDGKVDFADLAAFCNEWLSALPWAE